MDPPASSPDTSGTAAMPKLPARPAAARPAPASGSPAGAGGSPSAGASAPSNSTTNEPSPPAATATAAASAPATGDAGTSASSNSAGAATASPKLPARPSAGPSLPPRAAARTPSGGSASGSASNSTTAAKTSGSATAAPSPASAAGDAGANGPATAMASASTSAPAAGAAAGTARKAPPSGGLSALPPRGGLLPLPAQGPVLDPDEPESVAEVRRSIHAVRVQMISSALRLGYDHENALVKQVLYRLALAERLKAPWRRPGKRPDPVAAAAREAARLQQAAVGQADGGGGGREAAAASSSSSSSPAPALGFTVKIMLIGMQGSGKTQLAHALLGGASPSTPHAAVHPFEGATKRVGLLRGSAHGIGLTFIDTPGLSLAPGGAARNGQVLQQIRRAYHRHKPDLLVYVDRLDAPAPGGGAELAVLRTLTGALGPALWLNTIVPFTHAGAPPPSSSRRAASAPPMTFENWLEVRSHSLQQVIRQASGDERLMNPVAFAESHPGCPTNTAGQPVIYNGMPWRSHLLLMVTSAKLLADTEALLQMQGGGGGAGGGAAAAAAAMGGGGSAAAIRQMMGGARQVPLPYIMQQVTQMTRPLKFPDHRNVMDVRRARHESGRLKQEKQRREAGRQVALRVLALRQSLRKQRALADAYKLGTQAGCKVTPEPPRVATRCRPSALPSEGYRYRNPEAQGGWVVRPHVESHCADVSDGVEGFILNKVAVAAPGRRGEDDGLTGRGVPYHHYVSAQFTKEQRLLAARSEATLYHDPLGTATTSLSADLQTSAAAMGPASDVLVVLRTDTRLRGSSGGLLPKVTLGTVVARVGEEGRLQLKGPTALGLRVQAAKKVRWGFTPTAVRLGLAAAAMQPASELAAGRLGLGRGGDACLGVNAEIKIADLIDFTNLDVPLARSLPAELALGLSRSPEGDVTAGLGASVQYRLGAREMLGVRTTYGNRGRAGISLRAKSVSGWWVGLVAMTLPLGKLFLDTASDALRRLGAQRRLWRQHRAKEEEEALKEQKAQRERKEAEAQKQKGAGMGVAAGVKGATAGAAGGKGTTAGVAGGARKVGVRK